jgi:hypothetical protein
MLNLADTQQSRTVLAHCPLRFPRESLRGLSSSPSHMIEARARAGYSVLSRGSIRS